MTPRTPTREATADYSITLTLSSIDRIPLDGGTDLEPAVDMVQVRLELRQSGVGMSHPWRG